VDPTQKLQKPIRQPDNVVKTTDFIDFVANLNFIQLLRRQVYVHKKNSTPRHLSSSSWLDCLFYASAAVRRFNSKRAGNQVGSLFTTGRGRVWRAGLGRKQ
jgi:hypothetical protein